MKKIVCMALLLVTMLFAAFPFTAFSASPGNRNYLVNVHTLDKEEASTEGDIYLKLYGSNGETAFWNISGDIAGGALAEASRLQSADTLAAVIQERDVGMVTKIQIAYYGAGENDDTWGLDWIELDGSKYPVDTYLTAQDGYPCVLDVALENPKKGQPALDRSLVIEGRQYDKLPGLPYDKSYEIKIKTGTNAAAGTEGVVLVQLVGTMGESDWLTINGNNGNKGSVFKQNSEAVFFLSGQRDLGEIREFRVKIDEEFFSDDGGWQLESVTVGHMAPCPVNQWLQSADYLSVYLDTPSDFMFIKTKPKTAASMLSTPIFVVILGGSLVILTTAVAAAVVVKRKRSNPKT